MSQNDDTVNEQMKKRIEALEKTIEKMADHIMFSSNHSRVCVNCDYYHQRVCGPQKTKKCIIKYFEGES